MCGKRKARRLCPALGREICAVCCGTKRLVEIRCPADCRYVQSARVHPPAVQRRQQERDLAVLVPALRDLSEAQARLFWPTLAFLARYKPEGLVTLTDDDVAEAAAALAATFETAAKGVIYEHRASSLAAQRLAAAGRRFLDELGRAGTRVPDADAAAVFRAIERGARDARKAEGLPTSYLGIAARTARQLQDEPGAGAMSTLGERRSSLILP